MTETIDALVDGGKASAGPPLGPALGPLGVNIMEIVKAINEKTKVFDGMKVPVKVMIDPKTKEFDIKVGTPPASALILKELGIESGAHNARTDRVGDLTLAQVKKIAEMKQGSFYGGSVKDNAKIIIGTCVSMGVKVEGHDPREMERLISEGKYDKELS